MGPPHFRALRDLDGAGVGGRLRSLDEHAVGVVGDGRGERGEPDEGAGGLGNRGTRGSDGQGWEGLKKNLSYLLCFMGSLFHSVNENAFFKYCAK